jgi:hypothetical protein
VSRASARRIVRDDSGAYIVMYALLAVALATMAAIVLDIAGLRQGRRADRLNTDLAATAGAADLQVAMPSSAASACATAWDYVLANRSDASGTVTAPNCAGSFPALACTGATAARTASGSIGPLTVEITNPVPDNSVLMLADAQGGDIAQTPDPTKDGPPCERLAVRIRRTRTFLFGQVAGTRGGTTDVHSVARPTSSGGATITPLVTLDPAGCPGLETTGGATIRAVAPGGANDEAIAVDTNACGGATTAISGTVRAELPGPLAGFARVTAASNTGALAFGSIRQAPGTGAAPVEARYNTLPSGGCPVPNPNPNPCTADTLEAALMLGPGAPSGYTDVASIVPGFDCSSSSIPFTIPGRFFINCPGASGFNINNDLNLQPGTSLVISGNVTIDNNRCFSVAAAGCAIPAAPGQLPSLLFLRNGSITLANNGRMTLNNTVVYLANGNISGGGNPNSRIWWRAPAVGATTCPIADPTPEPACSFDDLMLWSKTSTAPHRFGGGSGINLEGVLYVPKATLQFDTSASGIGVEGFQAYANKFRATSGTVVLAPTPTRSVNDLAARTRLLR